MSLNYRIPDPQTEFASPADAKKRQSEVHYVGYDKPSIFIAAKDQPFQGDDFTESN